MGTLRGYGSPTEGTVVIPNTARASANLDAPWREPASDEDIFGVARYLADAVEHGEIKEEDGENALWEWAAQDRDALERAARHLTRNSEAERLLIGAYHHAA